MNIPRVAWLYVFLGLAGLFAPIVYLLVDLDDDDKWITYRHRGKEKRVPKLRD